MSHKFLSLHASVAQALAEDVGDGDVTAALVAPDTLLNAHVIAREPAILCGQDWFNEVFRQLTDKVMVHWQHADGDPLAKNDVVCEISGPARDILTGERTALNFLQTLSGTASITAHCNAAVAGTKCRILDTRKTIPGLRMAQKYAVRCGGGTNHRIGLFDAILIKENHIASAGGIQLAIDRARAASPGLPVEIEVESITALEQALVVNPERIMLDNFTNDALAQAVKINGGRCELEASGGFELEDLGAVASTGVDFISIGALTKHVRATDFSMRFTDSLKG